MFEIKGRYTKAKVMIDNVEESCISQIHTFVNHPVFTNPVAIMPDCHYGSSSCIGFTMELTDKVISNVIGVDIACGMLSINIGKTVPISLEELDRKIRLSVPFGQEVHDNSIINMKNDFPWRSVNSLAQKFSVAYQQRWGTHIQPPHYDMDWFTDKCDTIGGGQLRIINSLGTLGSGNHFCELGVDENGDHWFTIHTGSRNFGKRICEYWQNIAAKKIYKDKKLESQRDIEKAKETLSGKELFNRIKEIKKNFNPGIKMTGLEWLEGNESIGYLYDMIFAQEYASVNRQYIAKTVLNILGVESQDQIETVHNFIDFRDFVIRKGAVRSYVGERLIIPFNMRDGILICEGKSNPEWNCSAPHGAGRVMSRSKAKKTVNLDRFKQQMHGIFSTSVGRGTLDEAPDVYKDCKVIEEAIGPTAKILNRIKPIHNMKAAEDFKKRRKGKNELRG